MGTLWPSLVALGDSEPTVPSALLFGPHRIEFPACLMCPGRKDFPLGSNSTQFPFSFLYLFSLLIRTDGRR